MRCGGGGQGHELKMLQLERAQLARRDEEQRSKLSSFSTQARAPAAAAHTFLADASPSGCAPRVAGAIEWRRGNPVVGWPGESHPTSQYGLSPSWRR